LNPQPYKNLGFFFVNLKSTALIYCALTHNSKYLSLTSQILSICFWNFTVLIIFRIGPRKQFFLSQIEKSIYFSSTDKSNSIVFSSLTHGVSAVVVLGVATVVARWHQRSKARQLFYKPLIKILKMPTQQNLQKIWNFYFL